MTNNKGSTTCIYGIGAWSIFNTVFQYLSIFIVVMKYWVPPNVPLSKSKWKERECWRLLCLTTWRHTCSYRLIWWETPRRWSNKLKRRLGKIATDHKLNLMCQRPEWLVSYTVTSGGGNLHNMYGKLFLNPLVPTLLPIYYLILTQNVSVNLFIISHVKLLIIIMKLTSDGNIIFGMKFQCSFIFLKLQKLPLQYLAWNFLRQ